MKESVTDGTRWEQEGNAALLIVPMVQEWSRLECWQWTRADYHHMQAEQASWLYSSLGIRNSCTLHYNKNQIYQLQSVFHFFKNDSAYLYSLPIIFPSLFLHILFSSEVSLERKHIALNQSTQILQNSLK